MSITKTFTAFANTVARMTGRPATFVACIGMVLIWAVSGPLFGFSDTWQLVINTSTTIITFLMVFLIQNTQNRDNAAIQAKLDELIIVTAAHNRFVGIEKLTDKDLEKVLDEVEQTAHDSQDVGAAGAVLRKAHAKSAARAKPKPKASPRPRTRRKTPA